MAISLAIDVIKILIFLLFACHNIFQHFCLSLTFKLFFFSSLSFEDLSIMSNV